MINSPPGQSSDRWWAMSGRPGMSSRRSTSLSVMTSPLDRLKKQVEEFGREMAELLLATVPNMPEPVVETLSHELRYVSAAGLEGRGVPLFVRNTELAALKVSMRCRIDSAEKYLAIEESKLVLQANLE